MFKLVATLSILVGIYSVVDNPFHHAPTVQAATNKIANTTANVQAAATESSTKATALGTALQTHDPGIPYRLKEFMTSTERLTTLRARLLSDITSYENAANDTLQKFDIEAQTIKDPAIAKNMTVLRRKTEEDTSDRQRNASDTISLLDEVLAKGSDLQHAANCVLLTNTLHNTGETLDVQITDARTTATEYEKTTNNLLSKISSVLSAEK